MKCKKVLILIRLGVYLRYCSGEQLKKMINLIKEICINQLQIETILDTPLKLAQIVKNKGKKILNEDLKPDTQTKILK